MSFVTAFAEAVRGFLEERRRDEEQLRQEQQAREERDRELWDFVARQMGGPPHPVLDIRVSNGNIWFGPTLLGDENDWPPQPWHWRSVMQALERALLEGRVQPEELPFWEDLAEALPEWTQDLAERARRVALARRRLEIAEQVRQEATERFGGSYSVYLAGDEWGDFVEAIGSRIVLRRHNDSAWCYFVADNEPITFRRFQGDGSGPCWVHVDHRGLTIAVEYRPIYTEVGIERFIRRRLDELLPPEPGSEIARLADQLAEMIAADAEREANEEDEEELPF
ncbi:MAG: hypothetical protein RMN24_00715 [Anaerolineae bacterium]|nr:hypothetical protein [Caldilineales bacterium]MDW8267661.1 hypothetical protein [Anaerolineae bacterium]